MKTVGPRRADHAEPGAADQAALQARAGLRYSSLADITSAVAACGLTLARTWTEATGRPVLDLADAYRFLCDECDCNARDGTSAPDPRTLWQQFQPRIARAGGIEVDAVLRVFVLARR